MLSHHAMDPEVFQPHITRPLPPGHQLFRSVLIRLPHCHLYSIPSCLHSLPSCLHSSPSCSSALQAIAPHPTLHSGNSSRSSNREQASLPSAPIRLSSSSPYSLGVQLCWLCGGPFIPLSVCAHWSLCPRAREQCARTQEEGEMCVLPLPLAQDHSEMQV